MTKLAKSKFVQNKKVLKCADSRQQRATVLRVTVCKSDSSSRKEKKRDLNIFLYGKQFAPFCQSSIVQVLVKVKMDYILGFFFGGNREFLGLYDFIAFTQELGQQSQLSQLLKSVPSYYLVAYQSRPPLQLKESPFTFFLRLVQDIMGKLKF